MSRRVDPPYTRLFRGEDFDLTEFTLVLNEKKKNKKKQSTTKHNTEIEVKGSDSLLTLFFSRTSIRNRLLFDHLRGSFFNIEKRRHLGNEQSDH